jgi:hypothetical protein
LQLVPGVAELVCSSEFGDDFGRGGVVGNWREFEDVGRGELEFGGGGVVLRQGVQDFAGRRSEAGETKPSAYEQKLE